MHAASRHGTPSLTSLPNDGDVTRIGLQHSTVYSGTDIGDD